MQRHGCEYLVVCLAFLVPLLAGCIVPIPLGSDVTQSDLLEIKPGHTSRYEIELRLGEPNVLDENGFSVYQLAQGKMYVLLFPFHGGTSVDEVFNITVAYDSSGVVREIRYSDSVRRGDADLVILEEQFPDRTVDFAGKGHYFTMDISADGNWITAVSPDGFVFHEIGGEHQEITREIDNTFSSNEGFNCLRELKDIHAQKQDAEYLWMFDNPDITPFYRLCIPFGLLDISKDGNLLAVGNKNGLELWSLDQRGMEARRFEEAPISGIGLNAEQGSLVVFGYSSTLKFGGSLEFTTMLKLRSLPELNQIASIDRRLPVIAATFSSDGELFALTTVTHIELWERKKSGDGASLSWPYKIRKMIPRPSRGPSASSLSARPAGILRFSADGRYLMNIDDADGLLHVWDARSGRLLARIDSAAEFINSAFYKNEEIVAITGIRKIFVTSPFGIPQYKRVKLWRLPLDSVISQYGDASNPDIVPVSNLGLQPSTWLEPELGSDDIGPDTAAQTDNDDSAYRLRPHYWRGLISGNTASGKSEEGGKFHVYHAADGSMYGRATNRTNTEFQDSGTWEITNDVQFCRQWKKWRNKSRDCFSMDQIGPGKFRFKAINKPYNSIFILREGDPEHLGSGAT